MRAVTRETRGALLRHAHTRLNLYNRFRSLDVQARVACGPFFLFRSLNIQAVVETDSPVCTTFSVMAHRPDDSDDTIEDKNLFRIDNWNQRDNVKITKLSSIESPREAKTFDIIDKPEVESINDNVSIKKGQSKNKSSISEVNLVSPLENETNIPAKLKPLLQIDSNLEQNVDKVSSRESIMSDLDSNSEEATKFISQVNKRMKTFNESSTCFGESSTMTMDKTKNDWKKFHFLSKTFKKFAENEFCDINIEKALEKNADRPLERIHFSTPEVEKKWRNIVENMRQKRQKLSVSEKAIGVSQTLITDNNKNSMSVINLSRKRNYSEITPENESTAITKDNKSLNIEKKIEDELFALLGPIPSSSSKIFAGMSFILEYVSLDLINPKQLEAMKTNSEAEYLEQWTKRPFVRERLIEQINAAGGKLYEKFELVPTDKYATTKLIMNIPHSTEKNLLCLSVGIEAYSHQWIIRCCQENKIVNPAEERLPAGWSVTKQSYVETYQRPSKKPFLSDLPFIVVIPMYSPEDKFVTFWERIIGNSGGAVLLVTESEDEFIEGTVVLTRVPTPLWVIKKAKRYDIPLVTTKWAVQCLIEGQICDYDADPSFEYNAIS